MILAVATAGCNQKEDEIEDDIEDEIEEEITLCLCSNAVDIDKTIPVVDKFLGGLSDELNYSQQLHELALWLKSCPCITDAFVLTSTPQMNRVLISLDENELKKIIYIGVSKEKPLKAEGYFEFEQGTNISGAWEVNILSIKRYHYFESPSEDDVYPDFIIEIPDATVGVATGNTFRGKFEIEFEIKENQQIRFDNESEYVENELRIFFVEGVDAMEFAASHQGITPKRRLNSSGSLWVFETDGTENLSVVINRLLQDDNVERVERYPAYYTRGEMSPLRVLILSDTFIVSDDDLIFVDTSNNLILDFNRLKPICL